MGPLPLPPSGVLLLSDPKVIWAAYFQHLFNSLVIESLSIEPWTSPGGAGSASEQSIPISLMGSSFVLIPSPNYPVLA